MMGFATRLLSARIDSLTKAVVDDRPLLAVPGRPPWP